jgi:hypothetical protein
MSLVPKICHQSSTQLLSNATCNLDNSLTSVLHYFVDRLPEGLQLPYRNIDKKKTVLQVLYDVLGYNIGEVMAGSWWTWYSLMKLSSLYVLVLLFLMLVNKFVFVLMLRGTPGIYLQSERDNFYIERKELEAKINIILNDPKNIHRQKVFVLYGAKGVGKSCLMCHLAKDLQATLHVKVAGQSSVESFISQMAKIRERYGVYSSDEFCDSLRFARKYFGFLPVIIFELESEESGKLLEMVKSTARELATVAIVFIILSEANVALEFLSDVQRFRFILINDFTHEEARKFIQEAKYPFLDDCSLIFEKIGTRPLALQNLDCSVGDGEILEQAISSQLILATSSLEAFSCKVLLKSLKESIDDGVSTSDSRIRGIIDNGFRLAKPQELAKEMKETNAVIYDVAERKYLLASKALKTALVQMQE